MVKKRFAFTLIEVLISIVLMGIILPPLYQLLTLIKSSNTQIFSSVKKQTKKTLIFDTMYLDILSSDGNISVIHNDMSRLCIENTNNSLYGLNEAKVCWIVIKDNNTLVRVEGNKYHLPLGLEDRVEVDNTISNIETFDVSRDQDTVLVFIKQAHKEPVSFMLYGIHKPIKKKVKRKRTKHKNKKKHTQKGGKNERGL